MNEIHLAIDKKEHELKILSKHRIDQLEALIKERDLLLSETLRKFELLRNDFDYNLSLIDARDVEIQRLEVLLSEEKNRSITLQTLKVQLHDELSVERSSTASLREELNCVKLEHKKILEELKAILESVRWSFNEEAVRNKQEIATLQFQLEESQLQREEMLLQQRDELTKFYEDMVKFQEKKAHEREEEVVQHIKLLEGKLESIANENIRLRRTTQELLLEKDLLANQLLEMKDQVVVLEFKNADLKEEMIASSSHHASHVGTLQSENLALKNQLSTFQRSKEQSWVQMELKISALDEAKRSLQDQIQQITLHHEELQKQLEIDNQTLSTDNSNLIIRLREVTLEKDALFTKLAEKRFELEKLQSEKRKIETDSAKFQEETLKYCSEKEMVDKKSQLLTKELLDTQSALREAELRIAALASVLESKVEKSLYESQNIHLKFVEEKLDTLSRENERMGSLLESDRRSFSSENSRLQMEVEVLKTESLELNKQMNELKIENSALQHRIKSYQMQLNISSVPNDLNEKPLTISTDYSLNDIQLNFPTLSPLEKHPPGMHSLDQLPLQLQNELNLREENSFLKQLIKDLRKEMELLKLQEPKFESPEPSPHHDLQDKLLEILQKSYTEVQTLRSERKQLLENVNYLKHHLGIVVRDAELLKESEIESERLRGAVNVSEVLNASRLSLPGNQYRGSELVVFGDRLDLQVSGTEETRNKLSRLKKQKKMREGHHQQSRKVRNYAIKPENENAFHSINEN